MQSPADWIRGAIGEYLLSESEGLRARATGREIPEAQRRSSRARAALGTGEARERLEEAVSTRAIDAASHGALLEHLANAAEAEVFERRGLTLELLGESRVVVEDRERSAIELAGDARSESIDQARPAITALTNCAVDGRNARLEGFADAAEHRARIRSRGPAAPDATPGDLRAWCDGFLDASDDATQDLVARVHHASQTPNVSLAARIRALSVPTLDAIAAPRGRARRFGAVLDAIGMGRELAQRVEIQPGGFLRVEPSLALLRGRSIVLSSALEVGLTSERALLGGVSAALVHALGSPALPIEHARPAVGSAAMAFGALFEGFFADARFVARYFEASPRETMWLRTVSAAALVLAARHACVAVLLDAAPRSPEGQRELAARALVLDPAMVPIELAAPSRIVPRVAVVVARARLAALTWAPALRERYDADHFRNPRFSDFLRGAAARGGTLSAEELSEEIGASPDLAAARVVELAESASG